MKNFTLLIKFLSKPIKIRLFFFYLISLVSSFIDLSIYMLVAPFIDIATNPNNIKNNKIYNFFFEFLNFHSAQQFVIFSGIFLIVYSFIRLLLMILEKYYLYLTINSIYRYLSNSLLDLYFHLEYKYLTLKNLGKLEFNFTELIYKITRTFQITYNILKSISIIITIVITLLLVDFKSTLMLIVITSILILLSKFTTAVYIKKIGGEILKYSHQKVSFVRLFLENIKILKLQNQYQDISNSYNQYQNTLLKKHFQSNLIIDFINLIYQVIGIILLITYMLYIFTSGRMEESILIVSLFSLAIYRLYPNISMAVSHYHDFLSQIKFSSFFLDELNQKGFRETNINKKQIQFQNKITLENINFSYVESKNTLNNINLEIKKGQKIAFVGPSGSGKSTLIDLIIGLHYPSSGHIKIDGEILSLEHMQSWRKNISYIPQNIHLFDGTVAQNITFKDNYDKEYLIEVCKKAQIWSFLEEKQGLDTYVGDKGVQLSGGQKQRIIIARALYFNPQILILDEATSALDNETEEKIMKAIYEISKDRTLIIIAHRLSTIENCDVIYTVDQGKIIKKREQ